MVCSTKFGSAHGKGRSAPPSVLPSVVAWLSAQRPETPSRGVTPLSAGLWDVQPEDVGNRLYQAMGDTSCPRVVCNAQVHLAEPAVIRGMDGMPQARGPSRHEQALSNPDRRPWVLLVCQHGFAAWMSPDSQAVGSPRGISTESRCTLQP